RTMSAPLSRMVTLALAILVLGAATTASARPKKYSAERTATPTTNCYGTPIIMQGMDCPRRSARGEEQANATARIHWRLRRDCGAGAYGRACADAGQATANRLSGRRLESGHRAIFRRTFTRHARTRLRRRPRLWLRGPLRRGRYHSHPAAGGRVGRPQARRHRVGHDGWPDGHQEIDRHYTDRLADPH